MYINSSQNTLGGSRPKGGGGLKGVGVLGPCEPLAPSLHMYSGYVCRVMYAGLCSMVMYAGLCTGVMYRGYIHR